MSAYRARYAWVPVIAFAAVARAYPASAQGVAGAAVEVSVVTAAGTGVPAATVTLLDIATGAKRQTTTDDKGRCRFEAVTIGGPYRVDARFVGLRPAYAGDIRLHLGDRVQTRLVLEPVNPSTLPEVAISASRARDPGAGGPAYAIAGDAVRALPLLNRNITALFAIAPQATGPSALSIGGQHSRFNAIQVDGGSAGDFFGVNAMPGAAPGGRFISLEAVDEVRILVAPFDVRQGGFSGGLVNVATRSGSNKFHGSAFVANTRSELVGRDTAKGTVPDFDLVQYGASIGGPLVRNRLHIFATAETQVRRAQFTGPTTNDPGIGIGEATATRIAQVLRTSYGLDAGGTNAPTLDQPNTNVFLKLSGQPAPNSWAELTFARLSARSDMLNRSVRNRPDRDGWQLSESGYVTRATTETTRLKATSTLGAFTNEFIGSIGTIDDGLDSGQRAPLFLIAGDVPGQYVAGGSVKNAQGTRTRQRLVEITDNVSWGHGAHLITAGSQSQLLRFRDNFVLGSWGVWTFGSVDSLERRQPLRYEVTLPSRAGRPLADFSPVQLAGYLQDRWSATPRLTFTGGLRVDAPFIEAPRRNPQLAASAALGNIDTGVFPDGNAVISPRLGFSFALGSDGATLLRGGAGSFAGRPPYAWLSSAFSNTGQEQTTLICTATEGVPAPTTELAQLPTSCLTVAPRSQRPSVSYFASDFRFQQAIKYDLGIDRDFGSGTTASLDFIVSMSRDQLSIEDANLTEGAANSEGRVTYGTIAGNGGVPTVTPSRPDGAFRAVYRFANSSGDRSTAVAAVVRKRWPSGGDLEIGYNWSRTVDRISLAGFNGPILLQNNPVDGSLSNRRLRRSARDIPHNAVLTAVMPVTRSLTAALFVRARSGTAYAYTADGDANADGVSNNDLLFVPRDANNISLTNPASFPALESFIASERCLRGRRGRLVTRNACRNPAVLNVDASVGKAFIRRGARDVEITADIFNVPNLLNRNWGLIRESASREDKQGVLSVAGFDASANRPRYTILTAPNGGVLASRNAIVADASRWRVQLGARYNF